jgi:hypothetical protein
MNYEIGSINLFNKNYLNLASLINVYNPCELLVYKLNKITHVLNGCEVLLANCHIEQDVSVLGEGDFTLLLLLSDHPLLLGLRLGLSTLKILFENP